MDYAVSVYENAQPEASDGHLVRGFATFEQAREYARRRVRASVEELRAPGQARKELRRLWSCFGESALVVGPDPAERYRGTDEVDWFVAHPATAPADTDWSALTPPADRRPPTAP